MDVDHKLRGAIVGIGKIAQTGHLPAYRGERLRGLVEIVAASDPDERSRALAHTSFPDLRLYDSAEEMFSREAVGFVDICTTPQFHGEYIAMAVERHLHILCEKPFARTSTEADALAGMIQQYPSLFFMPCHQYRYSTLWRHFKDMIAEDPATRWFLQFNIFRTEADPGLHNQGHAWRTEKSISGGGILADTGVHYLYLSQWMMGMADDVTARTLSLVDSGNSVEDTATILLESSRGLTQLNLTWGADRRANSAALIGKAGSLLYDGTKVLRSRGGRVESIEVPDASDKSHYVGMYEALIMEFVEGVRSGRQDTAYVREAVESVKLLETCYAAATSGSSITVD